jgi:hypothetical protein
VCVTQRDSNIFQVSRFRAAAQSFIQMMLRTMVGLDSFVEKTFAVPIVIQMILLQYVM